MRIFAYEAVIAYAYKIYVIWMILIVIWIWNTHCMSMNYVIKEEEPIWTVLPEGLEYEYTRVMMILMNDKNA